MTSSHLPLALVTGSAHRLGFLFARTLAEQGYAILLHYNHSRDDAESTAEKLRLLDTPVFLAQADLTDTNAISGLLSVVDASPHPLRVLVNSAALMQAADAKTLSVSEWDATINLNLRAPFLLAQGAYKRMNEVGGGLIVNITDVGAEKTWSKFPDYTVSKAGLQSLTKILARSFAPDVRVNAIAPGLALPADDFPKEEWDRLINRLPIPRPAKESELASALEFLLKNEYITGQTITVDGGYSLL
ncbi:MAG: SDR family oxidoreductase [Anaerolineae bacterium]|jgi:NAD(P)-dependent dehydrogenase (short-subunit alcohol dehydrogenase family)|nr:SDR family oxidoreductase [Anaerolineae bacterium]MBT7075474.1 SDR family oxidoreductase [Anaerolineae bacterium]MBT7782539.1 SDR family oxidoreductase [Anaerolineae bacterium]